MFPWSNLSVRLPDDAPLPRPGGTEPEGVAWGELAQTMRSLRISPERLRSILQGAPPEQPDGWISAALLRNSLETAEPADWRRGWILVESDSESAA